MYDDLVESKGVNGDTTAVAATISGLRPRSRHISRSSVYESLYVNPLPNCSLINPDVKMIARFHKLGIKNGENNDNHLYDEVPTEEEALYDEVPFEDELTTSDDDDDDVMYFKLSDSLVTRLIPEPLYDIPPDAT